MDEHIDRREFVKRCVVAGAGLVAGTSLAKSLEHAVLPPKYELCSVAGDRPFEDARRAVEALGGMRTFVKPGSTVGILINSPLDHRGAYTNPEVSLAVIAMCLEAGAKQLYTLNNVSQRYWRRSKRSDSMRTAIESLRYSDAKTEVAIDRAKLLKNAEISSMLLSCDVFINIPIIKDHEGTKFTCTMKNVMGACSGSTCRRFHFGDASPVTTLFKGYYSDVETLAQSIADINLVRRPDLSVVDATEILVTNGPSGPGDIRAPREIIASTNCLAADMYAVRHLGLNGETLPVIRCALQHGYGPKSLKDVRMLNL